MRTNGVQSVHLNAPRFTVLRSAFCVLRSSVLLASALLCLTFAFSAAAQQKATDENVRRIVGAPAGTALSGAPLERATAEVGSLLRCPVCQGLSVYDSPAAMAVNMKHEVKDLLSRGYSREQILAYFEASYGEFVRLEPKRTGLNWLVWLAPVLALGIGGAIIALVMQRQRKNSASGSPKPEPARGEIVDALELAPELEMWILRVREAAYGWPGGRPPSKNEPKEPA